MSRLVIWFVALVTVIGSSNTVEGSPVPAKAIDLSKMVQFIQQPNDPNKQRILRLRIASSDSDSDISSDSYSDSESSGDDSKRIARERSKDRFVGLLEKVANEKSKNDRPMNHKGKKNNEKSVKLHDADNSRFTKRIIDLIEQAVVNEKKKYVRLSNRKSKVNRGRNGYLFRSENYDNAPNSNYYIQKQILEKLLSQTSNVEEPQPKPKKRLIPNTLTGPTVTKDDVYEYFGIKNEEPTGLEDYSKVYIVLNPQAVKNSKNKSSLNDLIARVLSLSSQSPKREPQVVEPFRYKGFVVNQNLVKRRFKEAQNKISRMGDEEKKLDPIVVPLERITAPPAGL